MRGWPENRPGVLDIGFKYASDSSRLRPHIKLAVLITGLLPKRQQPQIFLFLFLLLSLLSGLSLPAPAIQSSNKLTQKAGHCSGIQHQSILPT